MSRCFSRVCLCTLFTLLPLLGVFATPSALVFLDPAVPAQETLRQGLPAGARVVVLRPTGDPLAQMTAALRESPSVASVHVISHGAPGLLACAAGSVDVAALARDAALLRSWRVADVLFYGCRVGAGPAGDRFLSTFAALTGARVAASTTLTGRGGDWTLERGTATTPVLVSRAVQARYPGQLTISITNSNPVRTLRFQPMATAAGYNPGKRVKDLLEQLGPGNISSSTGNKGVAVTAVDNAHGTWQYALNATGATSATDFTTWTWTPIASATESAAVLLLADADTRLRFVPTDTWTGTTTLTVRAWDGTGTEGTTANTGGGGGNFSTTTETASLPVVPAFLGDKVSPSIKMNVDSTGSVNYWSSIVVQLANGNLAAIWSKDGDPGGTSRLTLRQPDGTLIVEKTLAKLAGHNPNCGYPIPLLGGGFALVWADGSADAGGDPQLEGVGNMGVAFRLYNDNGDLIGLETNHANSITAGCQFIAYGAPLANGGFILTWIDQSSGQKGRYRRFDALGNPLDAADVAIHTLAPNPPSIYGGTPPYDGDQPISTPMPALMPDGSVVLRWQAYTLYKDYFVRLAADGTPIPWPNGSAHTLCTSDISGSAYNNPPVPLSNGGFVSTYQDENGNYLNRTYSYRIYDKNGNAATPADLYVEGNSHMFNSGELYNGGLTLSTLTYNETTWETTSFKVGVFDNTFSGKNTTNLNMTTDFPLGFPTTNLNDPAEKFAYYPMCTMPLRNGGFVLEWTSGMAYDDVDLYVKLYENVTELPNEAPVNTVPGAQTTPEDTALVFSTANGNAISVSDADAGSSTIQVALSVTQGTLTLNLSGLTVMAGANGTGTVTFRGSQTNLNAALANITFTPPANASGSATLTLTTNDLGNTGTGGAQTDTDTVAITITAVNDAPTDIALSATSIAEDAAIGTTVGTCSTTDVETGETFTYTLVSGTGSTDNASFTFTGNALQTAVALNYETKQSYSIRVRTTDDGTPAQWFEKTFTITVTNVNETPTDISLSSTSINENSAVGTTVGTCSTTDTDTLTGQTFTYTLVAGEGDTDNASFTLTGNALKTATALNYETKSSYSIRLRSTDQGSLWTEKAFTITVNDLNEAPTDITLSNASVAENQPAGTALGTFSATDPDLPVQTFTYTLVSGTGSGDNASFSITGSTLQTAASFNYEAKSSYSIRVRCTDQGDLYLEKMLTITVTNVNETPTDITLSNTSVAENQPVGTGVGMLSTTDPDAGNTFTYTLVTGDGDTDNTSFTLDAGVLLTAAAFDYETKNSYAIRVRSTDQDGLSCEKTFTVSVTNINETPTDIALSSTSMDENSAIGTTVGTLSTTDTDTLTAQTFTYTLVTGEGNADNASFTLDGNALKTASALDYETKNSYSIRLRSTDQGGLWTEKAFTISISDVNEAPTDISLSHASVAENQPVGTALGTFSATDPDLPAQTFTYSLVGGTGSTDNASFSITGSTLQTAASFNYETKSSYSIRVRCTDQGDLSCEKTFTISVTNVNETPTDISLSHASVAENQPTGTTVGTLSTTDPDTLTAQTFTYTLVAGEEDTDNASFTIDAGVLQTAASFDYETKDTYHVRVRSTDQGGLWTEKAFTISVTDANDAPTDIALSNTSVAEGQPIGTVVGELATTDPDTTPQTFTYTLVDGAGSEDNASFTIAPSAAVADATGPDVAIAEYFQNWVASDLFWQSFTAEHTGLLTQMQVGTYGVGAGTHITLTLYAGEGIAGPALGTVTYVMPYSVNWGSRAWVTVPFTSGVPVTAGQVYTYRVTCSAPFDFMLRINNSYAGGRAYLDASCDYCFRSQVTIPAQLRTNAVLDAAHGPYQIRVRSTDQGGLWTEKTFTITAQNVQPDLAVKTAADDTYTGGNVYNTDQIASQTVNTDVTATYNVLLENDGEIADSFIVTDPPIPPVGWTVRFFDARDGGDGEITTAVLGDGWSVGPLAPGATVPLRVEVTADGSILGGDSKTVTLTATSNTYSRETDTVTMVTTKTPLTGVTLAASPTTSSAYCPVTLTAGQLGGGTAEYRFIARYVLKGVTKTVLIRDEFATNPVCTWTPAPMASYTVEVQGREVGRTTVFTRTLPYTVTSVITKLGVTASVSSPRQVGTTIRFTATVTKAADVPIEYQFWQVKLVSGAWVWTKVQEYSTTNTYDWTAPDAGNYSITAYARPVGSPYGLEANRGLAYQVTLAPTVKSVNLVATPASPRPLGTTVHLQASATTVTAGLPVDYQFWLGDSSSGRWVWTLLQDYSPTDSVDWTPSSARDYSLQVCARTPGRSGPAEATKTLGYRVLPAPTVTALAVAVSPATPILGQPATIAITPTLATPASILYQVKVGYQEGGVWQWTLLQDFDSTATVAWTPAQARIYTVVVYAKPVGYPYAFELSRSTTAKVIPSPVLAKVALTATPGRVTLGESIHLAATPTFVGDPAAVEYQFLARATAESTWTVIRGYNTTASLDWTPPTASFYSVVVYARPVGYPYASEASASLTVRALAP